MEICPKMPMLAFELKLCNSENSCFGEQILKYILLHYQENPESFQKEINELSNLRDNAAASSKDFMGLNILKKYYNQLQFISNRFPMKSGEACQAEYSWEDLYHEKEVNSFDIRYEQQCVLYNIGALHSFLGCVDKRFNDEGIKKSCTHFQYAAWAFQTVRDTYSGFGFTNDLNEDIMTFKMNLMLAQAQECVLEKSIVDNRKASITCKISTQIIDYFKLALTNNEKPEFQNSVGSRLSKDWKTYCNFKISYYTAIANYFAALSSAEQEKYGESIGYIQYAELKLNECFKMKNIFKEFQENLKYTSECIETKSKLLKKDNDFVYNQKIPASADLPEIKGVSLVKSLPIDFANDPEVVAQDIFVRLVSIKAHELSSLYSEEKAKLMRQINGQVDEKNSQLNQFMSALQINQLHLDNFDYLKLPKQLLECCAAISVKPTLLKEDIPKAMKSIVNVSVHAKEILDDIEETIEKEDKEYRDEKLKNGDDNSPSNSESDSEEDEDSSRPRKNSVRNLKLKEISKRYDVLLKNFNEANTSNLALHDAFNSIIKNLQILSLPLNELSEKLPAIQQINDEESKQIRDKLISLLAKVDEMKVQREQLLRRFQAAIQDDDITKMIASKQNEITNPSEFFAEQLKKHDQLVVYLQQNLQAQDNILRALAESNALFASDRKKILEATQQRNAYIDSLVFSYQSISDLIEKANKGVVFFQNLKQPLNELLKDAQEFCSNSKQERENKKKIAQKFNIAHNNPQLAQSPQMPMPAFNRYKPQQTPTANSFGKNDYQLESNINMMNLNVNTGNERPKLKDFLPFMKPQSWGNNVNKSTGPPTVDRTNHNTTLGGAGVAGQLPMSPQFNQNSHNQQFTLASSSPSVQPITNSIIANQQSVTNLNSQQSLSASPVSNSQPSSQMLPVPSQQGVLFQNNYMSQQTQFIQPSLYPNQIKSEAKHPSTQSTPPQLQPAQQFQSQSYQRVQAHIPPHLIMPANNPINQSTQMNLFYQQQNSPMPAQLNLSSQSASNQPNTQFSNPQVSYQNQLMFQQQQQLQLQLQQQQQQVKLKEQEELNQMKMNHQKIFEQKQMEQQLKEKEIQLKKQELEQREQEFKLQQQQFFLQQQHQQQQLLLEKQNFINLPFQLQQHQQQPQQPQQNFIPVSTPITNVAHSIQQPINYVSAQPQVIQPAIPIDKKLTESEISNLANLKPDSVYKPGYFKQIKIDENMASNLSTPQTSVPSVVLANTQITNSTIQPAAHTFIANSQTVTAVNKQPIIQSHQPIVPTPTSIPNQNPAIQNQSFIVQPIQASGQPIKQATNPSAIDDLLDLFDSRNQICFPTLQPLKKETFLGNDILDQNASQVHANENIASSQTEDSTPITTPIETKAPKQEVLGTKEDFKPSNISISLSNSSINMSNMPSPSTPNTNSSKKLNFLNNPSKLDRFVNEVNKFENHVHSLTKKTLANATILDKEWKELNDYQEKTSSSQTISVARCYPNKNRFPDLLPYDQTRVCLQSKNGDDYINATLIGELHSDAEPGVNNPSFIISQAPLTSSSSDMYNFWLMVIEQQVELIVCLCRDSELGPTHYWPSDKQIPLNINSLTISLLSFKETPHSVQRICSLKNSSDNQSRTVILLQHVNSKNILISGTPAPTTNSGIGLNEMPENVASFLKFIKECEHFYKTQQRSLTHPVLVHCMNGVSRSAVFLLLFSMIQIIDLNCDQNQTLPSCSQPILSDMLIRFIKQMRNKRKYMIQSMCHLKYAYDATLYYLKDILIKEGVLNNFTFNSNETNSTTNGTNCLNGEKTNRKISVEIDSNILNDQSLVSIQSSKEQMHQSDSPNDSLLVNSDSGSNQNVNEKSPAKKVEITSLADLCDPEKFSIFLSDDSTKRKQKFTKKDFLNSTTPNAQPQFDQLKYDPFRSLDPLAK